MNSKIKYLNRLIVMLLLVSCIASGTQTDVCMAQGTETETQTAESALKAYKRFLKKNVSSFTPVEYDFTTENTESYKTASYFLITDMDQDGIPELVANHDIAYKMARLYVYTFKNGKMKRLKLKTDDGKQEFIDVSSNADGLYEIYKDKKGYLHTDWSGSGDQRCLNSTYTIKNGSIWCYLCEEKDESVSPVQHSYRINGKSTTAKKYLKKYKKLKKTSDCWMLKNTSKNRKALAAINNYGYANSSVGARKDGERFEDVIMLEGMEETVQYEHAINNEIGFEIDYDYEMFIRQREADKERFISIYDDIDHPENYLEITYRSENMDAVAASVSKELSKNYEISKEPRELANAGKCIVIDASNGAGNTGTLDLLQAVYIIPSGDGALVGTAHYGFESADGFGRRFAYIMNTLVVINRS